jgi:hypothetical protein
MEASAEAWELDLGKLCLIEISTSEFVPCI